jgi:hypothetical protein
MKNMYFVSLVSEKIFEILNLPIVDVHRWVSNLSVLVQWSIIKFIFTVKNTLRWFSKVDHSSLEDWLNEKVDISHKGLKMSNYINLKSLQMKSKKEWSKPLIIVWFHFGCIMISVFKVHWLIFTCSSWNYLTFKIWIPFTFFFPFCQSKVVLQVIVISSC